MFTAAVSNAPWDARKKTVVASVAPSVNVTGSANAIECYEQLRHQALDYSKNGQGAPGLAVLMHYGLQAYMAALVESGTVVLASRPIPLRAAPEGLMGELTRVMVAMVLGAAEREIQI